MAVDTDAADRELIDISAGATPKSMVLKDGRLPIWPAFRAGLAMIAVLSALVGWLSYGAYQAHKGHTQRELVVQTARQGALDLTTIDHRTADADVGRILASMTGQFHDDFQNRSGAFVDVIKKNQSTSVGTVAEAGLESVHGDNAQVLVAVRVHTSTASDPDQEPKAWRMRIGVSMVDGQAKVADVKFVP